MREMGPQGREQQQHGGRQMGAESDGNTGREQEYRGWRWEHGMGRGSKRGCKWEHGGYGRTRGESTNNKRNHHSNIKKKLEVI
jgi:hypothetical protein